MCMLAHYCMTNRVHASACVHVDTRRTGRSPQIAVTFHFYKLHSVPDCGDLYACYLVTQSCVRHHCVA